jgi:RNA polymerase sigma-70 factor (ECF subfamily)
MVRLDRVPEAAGAYRRALELAGSVAERRFLEEKLRSCRSGGAGDSERQDPEVP